MKNSGGKTVRIADLCFTVPDSLPIFDEFICSCGDAGGGLLCRTARPLLTSGAKLAAGHDDIAVYMTEEGTWVFVSPKSPDTVQVSLSQDYKTVGYYMPPCENEAAYYPVLRNLLRTAVECGYFLSERLSLHSACVEINGVAVAFTGASGIGKSTRAGAWAEGNGAVFISGDRPTVRIGSHGAVAYGVPWDGKEGIFRQVQRPLKAVLEVRRSASVYLRRLSVQQARKVLVKQAFIPMWDTQAAVATIVNVGRLAETVPVYRLFCGPNIYDAKKAYDILFHNTGDILEEAEEMKIKDGFVLRKVAGEYIVMPTGGNIATFDGAVALNGVSAFLFEQLKNPVSKDDLVTALLDEYEIDPQTAAKDVEALLDKFDSMGLIE